MIDIIVEQAAIKTDFDYWTLDLKENGLEYNPQELKTKFLNEEAMYLGFKFKIEGIEFYSKHKDKVILIAVKQ